MARKVHEISFAIAAKLAGSFRGSFTSASQQMQNLKKEITDLNKQYKSGSIALDQYKDQYYTLSGKLDRATKSHQRFNTVLQKSQDIRTSMAGFAKTATLGGTGAAAIGTGYYVGQSLGKAINYEAQLSNIEALGNISKEQMTQMDKLAMQMGAKTKYSALQAAQGIEELLKSGMDVATIQSGGLEAALNLATAGELELAEAAIIMSDGLNGFKKDGMKAADVANILAGAANASSTSVDQIRLGLSAVGPVADGIGASFKEVNAVLAAFSNNALKGSDAGTSLKTFLANVQPHTDKASELFAKYGLINAKTGENVLFANGQLKDMSEVAGILRKQFKDLNEQQRSDVFYEIFGSDAVRAANILFKEGAEGIKKMYKEMGETDALTVAKKKMDNAAGAIEQFKGAMETLQISALKPTLPIIKNLALAAADMAEKYGPAIERGIANAITEAKSYVNDHFLNNPEFQKLPDMKSKVKFVWDDLMNSFEGWLNESGSTQIQNMTQSFTTSITEGLKLAAPRLGEAAWIIGKDIGIYMLQGMSKSLEDTWLGKLALNSGPTAIGARIGSDIMSIFGEDPGKQELDRLQKNPLVHNPITGPAAWFKERLEEKTRPRMIHGPQLPQKPFDLMSFHKDLNQKASGNNTTFVQTFQFSPTINGGSGPDVKKEIESQRASFEKQMDDWQAKQKRLQFSPAFGGR